MADNLSALAGVSHGFFSRAGGRSDGIYAGLNCGFGSDDMREAVACNRARVAGHLNKGADHVVTVYQVHSGRAVCLSATPAPDDLPKADAIVTRTPGLVVGILTADCGPVLFADAQAGVVACAHAGWRGAVSGILEATVQEMETLGARRGRIDAALGPCIHQGNYEVGEDFRENLMAQQTSNADFFAYPEAGGKPHFDLPGFVVSRLGGLGLRSVWNSGACTYADDSLFFSYRRSQHRDEPDYGRQISAIVLD